MWRVIASLLVLRDQVDEIAPDRATGADGTIGDAAHQATNSDHNPHYVAGVGSEIVTALDLTHDPAGGFDSYVFAEILRVHRDRRIEYVISNRRIFSSYATSSRPAWAWGPYSGIDPHTGHVHVSALDAPISDTSTRWNLEGFTMAITADDVDFMWNKWNAGSSVNPTTLLKLLKAAAANTLPPGMEAKLDAILVAALDDGNVNVVLPPDAIADLEEIKAAVAALPTAEETADAVADEQAERLAA